MAARREDGNPPVNDPDWKIVYPRVSQKELVKGRLRGKRERGTMPEWPDDLDAGRL